MSDSSKQSLSALVGSLLGLTNIAVGLRIWVRRRHNLPLMADDWFACLALISYIGAAICVFVMISRKVLGYSGHEFTPEQIMARGRTDNEFEIALNVLTNNTLACVKLSAIFFYRRIFCDGGRRSVFGTMTLVTIVVIILWLLVFQFLTGFQCGTHFSALWDGTYLKYCTLSFPSLYGFTISDFLLDVWILALPIPGIMRLNTNLRTKLSIVGSFLLAVVGLGASIARMVQYIKIELGGPGQLLNPDHQHLVTQSFFYTMLEAGIALVAVNLPSLRALSISLEAGEMMRSVRSLLELPFIRGSSSDITPNDIEARATSVHGENHKVAFFCTRPNGSSHGGYQEISEASLSFVQETRMAA